MERAEGEVDRAGEEKGNVERRRGTGRAVESGHFTKIRALVSKKGVGGGRLPGEV